MRRSVTPSQRSLIRGQEKECGGALTVGPVNVRQPALRPRGTKKILQKKKNQQNNKEKEGCSRGWFKSCSGREGITEREGAKLLNPHVWASDGDMEGVRELRREGSGQVEKERGKKNTPIRSPLGQRGTYLRRMAITKEIIEGTWGERINRGEFRGGATNSPRREIKEGKNFARKERQRVKKKKEIFRSKKLWRQEVQAGVGLREEFFDPASVEQGAGRCKKRKN